MIDIIGTFNTAKCFATTLEDGAREQIKAVCDTEAFSSSKIRIMPDVHAGKGLYHRYNYDHHRQDRSLDGRCGYRLWNVHRIPWQH